MHVPPVRRLFGMVLLGLVAHGALQAGPLRDRMRARAMQQMESRAEADRPEGGTDYAYGADVAQHLRYWPATGGSNSATGSAPLILFVHGGGWRMGSKENATGRAKVAHFPAQGYALASIDYRLVPSATVEQQAADVAASLAWLIRNAAMLGIDPGRIVLMGHSAGAHLVALVGTDPAYLERAGVGATALRGVIALDGAAYDVPAQMQDGPPMMQDIYMQAFGKDAARQRALSPTLHAAAPNAPAFLILHVQRQDGARQSRALADALRAAGTAVELRAITGQGLRGHMEINRSLGEPDYPATGVVDSWLKAVTG